MKTASEIEAKIAEQIEDITFGVQSASTILPTHRIIRDLGLDSLDYATLLVRCELWLGIKVQEHGVNWAAISTVAELADFLKGQQIR